MSVEHQLHKLHAILNGYTYEGATGCAEDHDLQDDEDRSLQEVRRVELVVGYHERMVHLSKTEGNEEDASKHPEGDLGTRVPFVVGPTKADSLCFVNSLRTDKKEFRFLTITKQMIKTLKMAMPNQSVIFSIFSFRGTPACRSMLGSRKKKAGANMAPMTRLI